MDAAIVLRHSSRGGSGHPPDGSTRTHAQTPCMPSPDRDPTSRPSHVLVVDGDRRVRQSVSDLIAAAEDLELTDAVADTRSALASLAERPADIVLIDPSLPDEPAGLALMATLRDRWPDLALVVMSCSSRVELRSMPLARSHSCPRPVIRSRSSTSSAAHRTVARRTDPLERSRTATRCESGAHRRAGRSMTYRVPRWAGAAPHRRDP